MHRSAVRHRSLAAESDDELARDAAAGGSDAFGELYRRHAGAAWGVAQAILRNPDDAADAVAEAFTRVLRALRPAEVSGSTPSSGARAPSRRRSDEIRFRPYLLTATRHAAIDVIRRRSRLEPSDLERGTSGEAEDGHPAEQVVAREELDLVSQAFSRLPERWRSALWLIDVEQLSTRDAGSILGVEANNAAQLATRARARLREHYLQAHVPNHVRPVCQDVVGVLGSYLAGTASRTRRAEVRDHVAQCPECAERVSHVTDLGVVLRRALLPIPFFLDRHVRRAVGRAAQVSSSLVEAPASSAASVVTRLPLEGWSALVGQLSAASPAVERLVAGISAAALVVGVSTAAIKSHDGPGSQDRSSVSAAAPPQGANVGAAWSGPPVFGQTGEGSPGARPGSVAASASSTSVSDASLLPLGAVVDNGLTPVRSVGQLAAGATTRLEPLGTGRQLLGPTLRGTNLAGVNLAGVAVGAADFTGANLRGATLSRADLTGALLSGTNLAGAKGPGVLLRSADVSKSVLTGANLRGADLTKAVAAGTNLRGADLTKAVAAGTNLAGADLTKAVAAGTNLRGADLTKAVAAGTNLRGADLTKAVAAGTNLRGADLTKAVAAGTNLAGADLRGANLSGANLAGANLADANLTGAVLTGANLTDANLAGTDLGGTGLEHLAGAVAPAGALAGPAAGATAPATLTGVPSAPAGAPSASTATAADLLSPPAVLAGPVDGLVGSDVPVEPQGLGATGALDTADAVTPPGSAPTSDLAPAVDAAPPAHGAARPDAAPTEPAPAGPPLPLVGSALPTNSPLDAVSPVFR